MGSLKSNLQIFLFIFVTITKTRLQHGSTVRQFTRSRETQRLSPYTIIHFWLDNNSDDVELWNKISSAPSQVNAARWWNHIASFKSEFGSVAKSSATPAAAEEESDDDDDFFGSSDEEDDEAAEKLKQQRVAEYNARKAAKEEKKGKVVAKSSITFDIKPFDDETNLDDIDARIRKVEMPGLVWGKSQKKPLAYGIFKLVIIAVVEDDKVSSDDLTDIMEDYEDVQSVDIANFSKI